MRKRKELLREEREEDLGRIIRKEKGWGITPAFSVEVKHKDKSCIDTSN